VALLNDDNDKVTYLYNCI